MCLCTLASTFSCEEESLQQMAAVVARSNLSFHCSSVSDFLLTFCILHGSPKVYPSINKSLSQWTVH